MHYSSFLFILLSEKHGITLKTTYCFNNSIFKSKIRSRAILRHLEEKLTAKFVKRYHSENLTEYRSGALSV